MRCKSFALGGLLLLGCASTVPASGSTAEAGKRDAAEEAKKPTTFVERTRERLAREQEQREYDERRDEFMNRQGAKAGH